VRKASSRDFSAQVAVMESQILRARKRLSASAPAHLRIRRARCRISTHCARAADQFLLGRRSAATAIYHFSRAALLTNWTHEIFIREEDEKDAASQLSRLQRKAAIIFDLLFAYFTTAWSGGLSRRLHQNPSHKITSSPARSSSLRGSDGRRT
jgi:hypothetical protein